MTSETTNVVAFPTPIPVAEELPYFSWMKDRFPTGELDYNPPLALFLEAPSIPNAWTSHVPEGGDPMRHRVDVYLRRRLGRDEATLDVGNVTPAGDGAKAWAEGVAAEDLQAALEEVIALAPKAGYARVALADCGPGVAETAAALGFAADPQAERLIRSVA